ncbi:MAG: hypothetical protein DRQ88_12675 [Epsilonproteobacteria bacterium]|nr:MAG: hypothetical protein DRQ88_12675 [Campylobacterota bacterium]
MWSKILLLGLAFLSLNAHTGVPKVLIMVAGQDANKKTGEMLKIIGEKFGATITMIELEKLKLPLYTPGLEKKLGYFDKKRVKKFQKLVKEASGFIICAPEYNGGIPPVTLNAITWASKITHAFSGKGVLVCSKSGGKGERIVKVMREQFKFIGMNVSSTDIVPDRWGQIDEITSYTAMNRFVKRIIK